MTLKSLKDRQRAEKLAHWARLIEEAGSMRGAAKLAGMDRTNFRRMGRKVPILTASSPARTS